jgi:hypothetical protein
MDWKTNPLLLAEKLILKIAEAGELSLDSIDARAVELKINLNILDQALALLHKNKQVLATTKRGTVYYSLKKVELPKAPGTHLTWIFNHYPYSPICILCKGKLCAACFPLYDPEEDTIEKIKARLIMTRDEYKALASGRTYIPKKKYKEAKVMSNEQLQLVKMFNV